MKNIYCRVETPKGSNTKYNYNPQLGGFELAKTLPLGTVFPYDFGFIPGTLGEDGDPLDVIILSEQGTFAGCIMKCHIIGAIRGIQKEKDGTQEENDRYLAVPESSVVFEKIEKLEQLSTTVLDEIKNFFVNYNDQEGKEFTPIELIPCKKAYKAIEQAKSTQEPTRLVRVFVPLSDAEGKAFPGKLYKEINKKLTADFGGVTVYSQSPANGIWKDKKDKEVKDHIIIYEVMIPEIDRKYWKAYKQKLEKRFRQRDIIIRQSEIGLL
ncbi:inorganic diphosphatase [Chryseobacterium sp.]|uniref:inorganic diphosphatase n=1 Tax=Chryseobacterium sp. TaxID=1871047 RepID=UPI0025B84802|nr:inorganic diphosphatase [Chryseobacterium sp.]MBV8326653.1 inorganic diphosphatase [Chryseobacterium sp.]